MLWRASSGEISRSIASMAVAGVGAGQHEEHVGDAVEVAPAPLQRLDGVVEARRGRVGGMASISARWAAKRRSKAGRKCSGLIAGSGGRPNGPVQSVSSGFWRRERMAAGSCGLSRARSRQTPSHARLKILWLAMPNAAPPAKRAAGPSASSMRKASFHFAMRSERANEPTLSWPASQPTARWTMVTSSLSPERAETMVVRPAVRAAVKAAWVSVKVPAWFGLISAAVTALDAAASRTRAASVTRKSSPTTCTRAPKALRETAEAFRIVLRHRVLDRDDRIAFDPAPEQFDQAVAVELAAFQRKTIAAVASRTTRRRCRARSRPRCPARSRRARSRAATCRALPRWRRRPANSRLRRRRPATGRARPAASRPRHKPAR